MNEITYPEIIIHQTLNGTLANTVAIGDYVDIDIPYTNKSGEETYYESDGWRVMGVDTGAGVVKLISTAQPLTFYYKRNPTPDSILELEKINSEVLTVNPSNTNGYRTNGFSTNDVKGLFTNSSIFSGISIPVLSDYLAITASSDLRSTGYAWWLATLSGLDLRYVSGSGSLGTISGGNTLGVRLIVTLAPDVMVKDGEGTSANPYRLNGIDYE